jgi:hypothetical protein
MLRLSASGGSDVSAGVDGTVPLWGRRAAAPPRALAATVVFATSHISLDPVMDVGVGVMLGRPQPSKSIP